MRTKPVQKSNVLVMVSLHHDTKDGTWVVSKLLKGGARRATKEYRFLFGADATEMLRRFAGELVAAVESPTEGGKS